ncbi:two-component system, AgrA family, sensor histidine kinase AgrC [Streptococcus equinus]|nr:two-component system, AgrA family, sensor histidine kinase AgrC [Streptococcus equinus]
MSILPECLAFLGNLLSLIIFGILFQEITKNKLSIAEWVIYGVGFHICLSFFNVLTLHFSKMLMIFGKDLALLLSLMYLSYRHKSSLKFRYHLFYALYPITVFTILQRNYGYFLYEFLDIKVSPFESMSAIMFSVLLVPPTLYYLISKWLNIDISNVRRTLESYLKVKTVIVINCLMAFYYFGFDFLPLIMPSDSIVAKKIHEYGSFIYFILLFAFLFYLNFRHGQEQKEELLRNQEMELAALENYSKHVESLYQEVRSFRHDYANVLMSLKVGIDQGDLDNIKKIYEEITADSANLVKNNKFDLTRLANISDSAVKSLMSAKFLEVENRSIEISLEVSELMKNPAIPLISYIRILSILFDNAIEGALESEEPKISVANFYQDGDFVFMIENSTKEKSVDLTKIFERGYSTKGDNRGLGLATLMDFQDDYENLSVETRSSDYTFTQVVRIYEGEGKNIG